MNSEEIVQKHGFKGPLSVGSLQHAVCQWGLFSQQIRANVPARAGVYVVVTPPGHVWAIRTEVRRGKLLRVSADERDRESRVTETDIIYIGKAGGPGLKATLQDRVRALVRHSLGEVRNHRGGQHIWLIDREDTFLLYWKECDDPRGFEQQLIQEFKDQHNGHRPFGNRQD